MPSASTTSSLSFLWLEITGRCQLRCEHCYADSGPWGTHGRMSELDWRRVLDEAADLGVRTVQFIGGEPTLHPALATLVCHAVDRGIEVEVFSNLVRVPSRLWEVFKDAGVSLATSYYSPKAAEHDAITGHRSHDRTLVGIRRALELGIPLRVGVISVRGDQDLEGAVTELRALGVQDVGVDRLRQVGRGVRDRRPAVDQLCGSCTQGSLAVSPTGAVWPCPFARWLEIGDVRRSSLAEVHLGETAARVRRELEREFRRLHVVACQPHCAPNLPAPQTCKPISCEPKRPRRGLSQ
ncbi:MAG TPA: radical SAM/SPASM domain-containing protein [Candidatus Dormibacteraeota bacterium]|jgi:MoaA/NifB/PqqE/SkfB family radical SAM enzyme|nr:radical SAM/SPASM domain-containing protein [Candidatus Dormibacteraeota bacterium]